MCTWSILPFSSAANLDLADFGRKEINLAEVEMPGLMSMRKRYGPSKAPEGGQDCWLSPHDHTNSCSDRDSD